MPITQRPLRFSLLLASAIVSTSVGARPHHPDMRHAHPASASPGPALPAGVSPQMSAADLSALLAQGKITSDLVLVMYAHRIRAHDDAVHAILALNRGAETDGAAAGTIGPLHGLPVLVKDNIETADLLPTTAGSLALAANLTHRDASLVARLRKAGGVVLGKTNLSEWANFRSDRASSGWSAAGGLTRNPWDTTRTACGSSAGSAAAIAAGFAPLAIGTETDGSITCPAAMNGIVGLKPTVGLVSRTGIVPISASQDTAGPMARTVRDAALLLNAIAGADPADPATKEADRRRVDYLAGLNPDALRGKRIGALRFAEGQSPDVRARFDTALDVLRAKGAKIVDIAHYDTPTLGDDEMTVMLYEFHDGLDRYLAHTPPAVATRSMASVIAFDQAHAAQEMPWFGQELMERSIRTGPLTDAAYIQARDRARRVAGHDGIDAMLARDHLDALVAPTIGPAWVNDLVNGDRPGDNTGAGSLAAVAGDPHLTVPMGQVKELPVGLSFIGPAWSEARLLALGYAYEQARGPWQPPPAYR